MQVVEKQILPTRNTVPAVRPEISEPLEPHPVLSSESPQCVSDPSPAHSDKSSVSKTGTPSPIRVPQYPVNRPAVLQVQKTLMFHGNFLPQNAHSPPLLKKKKKK